jgi:hypothetical protein
MRRRARNLPAILLGAGIVLLAATALVAALLPRAHTTAPAPPPPPAPVTTTQPPATTTAPPPPPPSTTTAPPPTTTAPTPVGFAWQRAGGLVVHATDIDPEVLGHAMRDAGFGWVAILLADGSTQNTIPEGWVVRFRAASGLPVGGWSVLRDDPTGEAQLAATLLQQNGLQFFIGDAELEYEYTNNGEHSSDRFARSREFVSAFRAAEPSLPLGVSSYCRADMHDIDWKAWTGAGAVFLPQAYVEQLGPDGDPATCVRGALSWFKRADVHPTIGVQPGSYPTPNPDQYGQLLAAARVTGFSVYPAENATEEWAGFGQAIAADPSIAAPPGP